MDLFGWRAARWRNPVPARRFWASGRGRRARRRPTLRRARCGRM